MDDDSPHFDTPQQKWGPVIAIIIILILLIFGALYYWRAHAERMKQMNEQIPYIPSGTTTIIIKPNVAP